MRKYVSQSNFTGKLFYLFIDDINHTFTTDDGYYSDSDIVSIDRLAFYDICNGLLYQNYRDLSLRDIKNYK